MDGDMPVYASHVLDVVSHLVRHDSRYGTVTVVIAVPATVIVDVYVRWAVIRTVGVVTDPNYVLDVLPGSVIVRKIVAP